MINQILLVGRLVKTPELFVTENGKKGSFITLAVGRPYKNPNGEYDTDFLDCTLWTGIAENTAEYCKTGDVIGVRGRLQSRIIENEDGSKYKRMEIIADKVTFLASSKINKEDITKEVSLTDDSNDDEKSNNVNKSKRNKKN